MEIRNNLLAAEVASLPWTALVAIAAAFLALHWIVSEIADESRFLLAIESVVAALSYAVTGLAVLVAAWRLLHSRRRRRRHGSEPDDSAADSADTADVDVLEPRMSEQVRPGLSQRLEPRVSERVEPQVSERVEPSIPERAVSDAPRCPKCASRMLRRQAVKGPRAGRFYWGCSGFPGCDGVMPIRGSHRRREPVAPTQSVVRA